MLLVFFGQRNLKRRMGFGARIGGSNPCHAIFVFFLFGGGGDESHYERALQNPLLEASEIGVVLVDTLSRGQTGGLMVCSPLP